MPESWKTRLLRWKFNFYPAYRRSGARVTYIDASLLEVRIRLPLNRATRNLNGTIYGGSIYAAVDPLHAIMLVTRLGSGYQVWTKEARVQFKRQGRTELTATAALREEELHAVRAEIDAAGKAERTYPIDLRDREGHVCASCEILVHFRKREGEETRVL
ncbi:MAG: DUF4442 domain-containing protein [Verrucomicrobia bacterium]|nr:DUF4442 domain-containing protein [Verrucomicrobiota bacterium]MBV9658951.1 DUF4442 domain-containing protein [Verrucomicrobiota bacterium]